MLLERDIDLCEPSQEKCIRIGALFATGSGDSFISREVADTLGWAKREHYDPPYQHKAFGGQVVESDDAVRLRFKCQNGRYSGYIEFFVVDNAEPPVIIGALAMEQMGMRFQLGKEPGENDIVLDCKSFPVGPIGFGGQTP